jgi:predicted nucleotide-binding protein (sugar kinase/HSP70/actin superfamily)
LLGLVIAMEAKKENPFHAFNRSVGRFGLRKKTVLIPQMNRIAAYLFAATFRGFGIQAKVLETYRGIDLGLEYTSGKECFPCQVTLGDILYFVRQEKERLGEAFNPEDYLYFLPEAEGPCRFGMYNKYQRIVLDSFPGLDNLKIVSITSLDGYSLSGLLEGSRHQDLRKAGYFSLVVADLLDRLLWRVRPYEKEQGMADDFMEAAVHGMADTLETYGPKKRFDKALSKLEDIVEEGKGIINPRLPRKPLIGIVGEVFVRMHRQANHQLIRTLEKFGAEVVNASLTEWVNFTSYVGYKTGAHGFRLDLKQLRLGHAGEHLKKMMGFKGELLYQEHSQKKAYKKVQSIIDLEQDHKMSHLDHILQQDDLFSIVLGTEPCCGIAGIVEYARRGYNGVVNVYPFTCMLSLTTSAIVKPVVERLKIPFLDAPCDSSIQPGREAAIRTFMYQAHQHMKRNGKTRFPGTRNGG